MTDRYELMNQLYQWIVLEQSGAQLPQNIQEDNPTLVDVKKAIAEVAATLCYSSGGNKYETQLNLAKLFTAGLINFERDKDGEFRIVVEESPDVGVLEEYNEKLEEGK